MNEILEKEMRKAGDQYPVTVVTPFYNVDLNVFRKCFESLKVQTIGFENLEWIVVVHNSRLEYLRGVREDCVYVYERDNGAMYDLTDSDMDIKNFRQYIYDCMIETCENRQYLLTIDYNRNVFRFTRS